MAALFLVTSFGQTKEVTKTTNKRTYKSRTKKVQKRN